MTVEATNFPGWPGTLKDVSYAEWKAGVKTVPKGEGLFHSHLAPILSKDPHPEFVKEWRKDRKASVSETAQHFGLSAVQVLEATGR
jgi:hypothetical protein